MAFSVPFFVHKEKADWDKIIIKVRKHLIELLFLFYFVSHDLTHIKIC